MQAIEVMSRTKPTSTLTKKALQMVGIQRDLLEEKASRAVNTTLAMLNRWGFRQGDIIEKKAFREVNTTRSPLPCPLHVQSCDHSLDVPSSKHDHGSQSVWHDKGHKNWRGTW